MTLLWIALGAALGAPLRYALALAADGRVPWGTFTANLVASFGAGWFAADAVAGIAYAAGATGFCGALSTWSGLAVQAVDRGPRLGTGYLVLSVLAGLLACAAGFRLAA